MCSNVELPLKALRKRSSDIVAHKLANIYIYLKCIYLSFLGYIYKCENVGTSCDLKILRWRRFWQSFPVIPRSLASCGRSCVSFIFRQIIFVITSHRRRREETDGERENVTVALQFHLSHVHVNVTSQNVRMKVTIKSKCFEQDQDFVGSCVLLLALRSCVRLVFQ